MAGPPDPGPSQVSRRRDGKTSSSSSSVHLPQHPEPVHLRESHEIPRRPSSASTVSDHPSSSEDEREATELRNVDRQREQQRRRDAPPLSRVLSPGKPLKHWYDPVRRYWRHEIRISVPHVDCRDHLANERTFLGYLRTSVILSMIGVFVAQFYRLQHGPDPHGTFGYYAVSIPVSVLFQSAALLTVLVGGWRFWRQQSAMARGRVHAGGWEIMGLGVGLGLLLCMLFGLHIALNEIVEDRPWSFGRR